MPDVSNDGVTADSAAKVHRFYEAMNSGEERLLDEVANEILAPDWVNDPLPPGTSPGSQAFKPTTLWLRSVMPDFAIIHEDFVAAGDKVAVRSVSRGTHSGELLGVPATGRKVEYRAFDFHHLEGGRIVRTWHLEDFFGLLNQLGATYSTQS